MWIPLWFIFISPTVLGSLVGILANLGEIYKVNYILRMEAKQSNPEKNMDSVWQILFSWPVLSVVVAVLIGVGWNVVSASPPDLVVPRVCFSVSAVILLTKTSFWLSGLNANKVQRMGVGALIFAVIGGLWIWSLDWVASRAGIIAFVNDSARIIIPSVIWKDPDPIIYGTALSTRQLNAKSSVDGFFSYTPGVGTILPAGTFTIAATFTPTDQNKYSSSTAYVRLVVNPEPLSMVSPSVTSFAPEVKELEDVAEFITKKDEMELRDTFDLPKILSYNIKMDRRTLAPNLVSATESSDIDNFFKNGAGRADVRYINMQNVNDVIETHFIPGKIGIINVSAKYMGARKKLAQYISSPVLPSAVVDALRTFDSTIEKNSTLMIESLNDSFSTDPRTIIESEDPRSPFAGRAVGRYWRQFDPLKPKAEKVNSAIRHALGVK